MVLLTAVTVRFDGLAIDGVEAQTSGVKFELPYEL